VDDLDVGLPKFYGINRTYGNAGTAKITSIIFYQDHEEPLYAYSSNPAQVQAGGDGQKSINLLK